MKVVYHHIGHLIVAKINDDCPLQVKMLGGNSKPLM
jgi:hypothetical protein